MTTPLSYEVFVTVGAPRDGQYLPNGDQLVSSPVSSTLVYGERDALLVDPPLTYAQAKIVSDGIEQSGKRLAYIYVTHGHGDHWFTTTELLKRFPGAKVYATEGTIEVMHQQAVEGRAQMWDRAFPGLIPPSPVVAEPIPPEGFLLEGNVVAAVETGHTDTERTSVLHVPSIGLVVAGDVAYNGVHLYILEGRGGGFEEWIKALDKVAALQPRAVVAGHKNKDLPDDPAILGETQAYLRDVINVLDGKPTAREFFDKMLALHPDRLNPGPVWYGAVALLGEPS